MVLSVENKVYLKKMSNLALPMVLQDLLSASVNLVGTFMVASLGIHSVTAVGLANVYFFLFTITCFGIVSGAAVFMGQFWGKRDIRNIRKTLGVSITLTLVIALLFAGVAFFAPEFVMGIYSKNDEQVIALGASYLRVICFSYFLTAIVLSVNQSLKCIGQTKLPAMSTFVALVFDVLLNILFIFVFKWGVVGAAYAALISRAIEIVVVLTLVKTLRIPILGPIRDYFTWNWPFIRSFSVLVAPILANEFIWAVGNNMYSVLYKTTGTEGQGAAQIAGTMQQMFMVFGFAIGNACGILIANSLGANEIDEAIGYSRKSLVAATSVSVGMSLLFVMIAPFIISIYNVPDAVKADAFRIVIVLCIGMALKTLTFINLIGILRAGGDTKFVLLVDTGAMWLVGIPLVFLASYVWGLPIYLLVALTYMEDLAKFIVSIRRVLHNKWARNVVEDIK